MCLISLRIYFHVLAFRGTKAIFKFCPESRDIGPFLLFEGTNMGLKTIHILAPRMKLKNRLGTPKSNEMKGLLPNDVPIWPRRWDCRGEGCQ